MLAAIFGGALYGIGIGLALSQTASTGGTDILGRIAQHFFPHMAIGRLLSGVHWLTDIVGGALLSTGLVLMYRAIVDLEVR